MALLGLGPGKKDTRMVRLFSLICVMLLGGVAVARADGDSMEVLRQQNLQMSRYDQVIGKLQASNEQLMSQVRDLQRQNDAMAKAVQATNARSQSVMDDMQAMRNTEMRNLTAAQRQLAEKVKSMDVVPWGAGQRDCPELKAVHQQIKLVVKPDGSRGVKFLCYDGKALNLGGELYMPQAQ